MRRTGLGEVHGWTITESLEYTYKREVLTANEGRVAGRGSALGMRVSARKKKWAL